MGGLTPAELATIRERLEAFADDIFTSLPRTDQRARGQCYLRGLLLDGRRKSIEPMAQRLGEVHYQALGHFVATSPWDWRPVRRRLVEVLTAALAPTAWVVDDTGFPKDGSCSVGCSASTRARWARPPTASWGVGQRGHRAGKLPAGLAAVVPERWDEEAMATRRAACHLPEGVHHRPKWQLVLDLLDELAGWDLVPPVLLADSGYGEVGEFRAGLDARQAPCVVEVRSDTSAYPEQVRPRVASSKGRGRRPRPRYRDQPSSLKELAMAAGQQACVELIWRRGSRRPQRGRFLALRMRPAGVIPRRLARQDGGELPVRWLLAEWPVGKATRPSTGCRACPRPPRWWSWSAWPGCAGEWNRTTASSKAPLVWTTSRVAAGLAGTTTSPWSRSRTAF